MKLFLASAFMLGVVMHAPASAWIRMSTGRGYAPETMNPAYAMVNLLPPGFKPQVTGMDTLSDGTLVLSTREDDNNNTQPPTSGKIQLVKGLRAYSPSAINYRVIAEGLFEPMGVAVVRDTIYTVTIKELIRFVDADKDGYYESKKTVCSGWPHGGDIFEWSFGLVHKDGWFYANLASNSGTDNPNQSTERGSVIRMRTDNTFEILNTGIRRANGIGLGPDDDIFVTDNQGEWTPTNRLIHVQKDKWYGYHNGPNYNPKKFPLGKTAVWLEWWATNRSPSQPSLLIKGPYAGQMITGDCTDPIIRRMFLEKVGGEYQGAAFHWATMDKSPANRFLMSNNGDILVGGLGSFTQGHADWNWGGGVLYGLQVLRPTGTVPFDILAVRAVRGGFDLEFTKPVGAGAENGGNYEIKTWGYIYERKYDSRTQNERSIYPTTIKLSPDRKRVFLALGDLTPGNVVYFRLGDAIKSQSNESPWVTEAWYTMNSLGTAEPFQATVGIGSSSQGKALSGSAELVRFNSATRLLEMAHPEPGGASVIIRNLKGVRVESGILSSTRNGLRLPAARFPDGIYSVEISAGRYSRTVKLAIH